MTNFENGETRMGIEFDVLQINAIPFNNPDKPSMLGKYGLVCVPNEYNESGVFALTEKQLVQIVQALGMSNPRVLSRAAAKGGCKFVTNWQFCKAGEEIPGTDDMVFTKDHWQRTDGEIELSIAAENYVDKINTAVDIDETKKSEAEAIAKARDARKKAMMSRLGIANVDPNAGVIEAEEEEAEEEEAETAPAAKKPTRKRKATAK